MTIEEFKDAIVLGKSYRYTSDLYSGDIIIRKIAETTLDIDWVPVSGPTVGYTNRPKEILALVSWVNKGTLLLDSGCKYTITGDDDV